jgi:galactitol-specific phosphotransferase system IIC component
MPLADLYIVPIFYMYAAAASKGNLAKTLINGTITSVILLFLTTSYAQPLTDSAAYVNYALPAGMVLVSNLDSGANLLPWIVIMLAVGIFTGQPSMIIAPAIIGALWVFCWIYAKDMPEKLTRELEEAEK